MLIVFGHPEFKQLNTTYKRGRQDRGKEGERKRERERERYL